MPYTPPLSIEIPAPNIPKPQIPPLPGIPTINLSLWTQKIFEFGITLPIPELPKPSLSFGGISLALKLTCPGAPFCGNPNAPKNCSWTVVSQFKIPGFTLVLPFPPKISLPKLKVKIAIPPKWMIPLSCPKFPDANPPDNAVNLIDFLPVPIDQPITLPGAPLPFPAVGPTVK